MTGGDPSNLFAGVARDYARYRRGYPPALIDSLIAGFALSPHTPTLDLGCGTGQLAIPLTLAGVPVWAVDPDTDMLAQGRADGRRAGADRVTWLQGDEASLGTLALPTMRLCVMADSFHWMARERVLQTLDEIVAPEGGLAVVSGQSIWSNEQLWARIAQAVVVEFLGEQRRAGQSGFPSNRQRHEQVLAGSPFCRFETATFSTTGPLTVDEIVGLQRASSYAAPTILGDRAAAFESRLRADLRKAAPDGIFQNVWRWDIITATRPAK